MRPIIYHPSGRAGEYANKGYAVNLFRGCTHSCSYCYVPMFTHTKKEVFHASVSTAPDVLERLEADMKRIGKVDEPIFLCFTCDPYCVDADTSITREAIKIILDSGNTVNILTKGGMKATRDFDLLSSDSGNKIGATLTFLCDADSIKWEPNAAYPRHRLRMLNRAQGAGIQTWASIEPVIIPPESLVVIERAIPYVDEFKIGKLNHHPLANKIDWGKFYREAKRLMEKYNKKAYYKIDLLKAAGVK